MSTEAHALEINVVTSEFPRVIRRDLPNSKSSKPRVVPWIGHKIERAVDAACAAVGHEPVGKQIQAEVEFKMKTERPLFIHIEQLQDLVENLLVELNYELLSSSCFWWVGDGVETWPALAKTLVAASLTSKSNPIPSDVKKAGPWSIDVFAKCS